MTHPCQSRTADVRAEAEVALDVRQEEPERQAHQAVRRSDESEPADHQEVNP